MHSVGCRYAIISSLSSEALVASLFAEIFLVRINISSYLSQDLAIELAEVANKAPGTSIGSVNASGSGVPLLARVYLKLGNWQWTLFPGLDDDSVQGTITCGGFLIFADAIIYTD